MALEPESALVQGLGLRLALGLQPESVLFVAVGRLATVVRVGGNKIRYRY